MFKKILLVLFIYIFIYYFTINYKDYKENFDIIKNNNEVIPRKVFLTWTTKELPPKMQENYEIMRRQNPEFEFNLYDDDDCRDFIAKYFDTEVLDAYDNLIPGAYKADLWRLCVIWYYGGIYLDIKMRLEGNTRLIDLIDKEHYVKDREGPLAKYNPGIYNAILINKPRNPFIWDCLQEIVKNVHNNFYGLNCLHPTGPGLMGMLYSQNKNKYNLPDFDMFHLQTELYISYNNKKIFGHYPEYRKELKQTQYKNKQKHYCDYWRERNVYKN